MSELLEKNAPSPEFNLLYGGEGTFVNRSLTSVEASSPGSNTTHVRVRARDTADDLGFLMGIRAFNTSEPDFTVKVGYCFGNDTVTDYFPLFQIINGRNGEYIPIPPALGILGRTGATDVNLVLEFASADRDFIIEGHRVEHLYA